MQQPLDSIDQVKQAFTEWREQRPRRCPIPDHLWDMVKPLLDEYPRSMITRFLGISSSQLRSRFSSNEVTFVEAVPSDIRQSLNSQPAISTNHSCDIELKRPCGSVLKINGLPISVVTTLIPSFVG